MGDLRKSDRKAMEGKVHITWTDSRGQSCSGKGECMDISEGGMRLRMSSPLDVRGYVSIRFGAVNLHGAASVRSCTRSNLSYVVGLEFTRGLKIPAAVANS